MNKSVVPEPISDAEFKAKEERISKEIKRLERQFSQIEEKRKNVVEASIKDAAFCTVTMDDLRENMMRYGTVSYYQNGNNQFGTKQSPEAELYIKMSQRCDAAIKTLLGCMPKVDSRSAGEDGFDEFTDAKD